MKSSPRHGEAGAPSQRQLRVAELVRHAISDLLARGDINDPVIAGHLITVPEVRMSPDLRLATIYVVPLGGKDEAAVLKALEAHHKFIRTEIAHRVNLRFAPDIRFRRDDRFEEAERIDRLLRSPEVARDLGPLPSPLAGEGGETEQGEVEPGEGAIRRNENPSPASRSSDRSAPSPTRGEGKEEDSAK